MNTKTVTETAKKASSKVVKFASGGLGFGVGLYGMSKLQGLSAQLPAFIPEVVKKLTPGLAVMFLSYFLSTKVKDDRIQSALLGVGFSGGADALRRLLGTMFPGIKDVVPGLEGAQGAKGINVGDFQYGYYKENAFQGLGSFSMQGMSMQGTGNAYSLNGGRGGYSLMGRRKGLRGTGAYALN